MTDEELRTAIEEALRALIAPGATFPFSGGSIDVSVISADAEQGKAELDLGRCRLVEGTDLGGKLASELEQGVPGLRHVSFRIVEI